VNNRKSKEFFDDKREDGKRNFKKIIKKVDTGYGTGIIYPALIDEMTVEKLNLKILKIFEIHKKKLAPACILRTIPEIL